MQIKPCPFCGGEAEINTTGIKNYNLHFYVFCTACFAETTQYACQDWAESAWNKRVGDTDDK